MTDCRSHGKTPARLIKDAWGLVHSKAVKLFFDVDAVERVPAKRRQLEVDHFLAHRLQLDGVRDREPRRLPGTSRIRKNASSVIPINVGMTRLMRVKKKRSIRNGPVL